MSEPRREAPSTTPEMSDLPVSLFRPWQETRKALAEQHHYTTGSYAETHPAMQDRIDRDVDDAMEMLRVGVVEMSRMWNAAIERAVRAERTLQEWQQDYGPLIAQSRQHITTEDADVPVRAADRDEATLTMPFTDGGKDGAR